MGDNTGPLHTGNHSRSYHPYVRGPDTKTPPSASSVEDKLIDCGSISESAWGEYVGVNDGVLAGITAAGSNSSVGFRRIGD